MGKFLEEIESLKPLAESRGFDIGPQNVNGEVSVLLTRTQALVDRKYFVFETVCGARAFVLQQPGIPRHKVRVTYADSNKVTLEVYARKTHEAMSQAADAGARRRPGSRLKALEIIPWES